MLIIFIRTIVLYTCILVTMRIMGKRQLGELEASELAVTIIISELAAIPMQNIEIPLLYGILPSFTIVGLEFLLSFGLVKSIRFRSIVCGKPSIIIQNGEILQKELRKNRISIDEIIEALRMLNVTDISTIKYGVLETSGKMSVLPYGDRLPLTLKDMEKKADDNGIPIIVVSDGRVLSANMEIRNVDKTWIENYLKKNKYPSAKNIFLMTIDDNQNVYVAKRDRKGA